MSLIFKENQSEEFYRKLLLLDKVKPFLYVHEKQYIFNKKMCWNILFKDPIARDLYYCYARDTLKGRFEIGEASIATDPCYSYLYARDILEGRFEIGESIISTESDYSYLYAYRILEGRFELGEPAIAKDAECSYCYAENILKDRFPLGEPKIFKSYYFKKLYLEFLESIGKRHELPI